nr:hypothetical protein [Mycoplasmopsis felis]
MEKVKNGDLIALDGTKGDVVINPNQDKWNTLLYKKKNS